MHEQEVDDLERALLVASQTRQTVLALFTKAELGQVQEIFAVVQI